LAVVCGCWTLSGCTQTASFRQLRSAQVDTSLHRLAVVNVVGSHEASSEAGAALWERLGDSGCYQLVSEEQLQQWSNRPLRHENRSPNMPAIIDVARHAGVDGILLTRIRFVEPDESIYGTKAVRFGDPQVAAAMTYVLIDARSASVVSENQVKSDYHQGELDGARGPHSETRVFSKLAREAGDLAAKALAPHETDVHVTLANGGGDVRKGIKAAKDGDWKRARDHWTAAVEADAKNHAAFYNLGLACEATGDLAGARHCYETALKLSDKGTYQETLARLKDTEADVRLAWSQKSQAAAHLAVAAAPQDRFRPAAQPGAAPHDRYQPATHPTAETHQRYQPASGPAARPEARPATYPPRSDMQSAPDSNPSTWLTKPPW
jgi:tetratricopeptide (TPR) repeat protein